MPDLAKLSLGAVILSKRGKAPTVARELKAKVRTVESWLDGRRLPGDDARKVIQKKYPECAVSSWDHPAVDPPKPSRASLVAKFEASRIPGPVTIPDGEDTVPPSAATTIQAMADLQMAAIHRDLRRLDSDPLMPPDDKAKTRAQLATTLAKLAKFTGDAADISEAKILRSPAWERIRRTYTAALEPWPDALRAVGEALADAGSR